MIGKYLPGKETQGLMFSVCQYVIRVQQLSCQVLLIKTSALVRLHTLNRDPIHRMIQLICCNYYYSKSEDVLRLNGVMGPRKRWLHKYKVRRNTPQERLLFHNVPHHLIGYQNHSILHIRVIITLPNPAHTISPLSMSSVPSRFQPDIVVQDYYRPEGHAVLNFEWGSYDGYFSGGKANGWGVQSIRRRIIPGGLPSDEIAVYRGDWKNGKREGYGRLEIPWENKVYEGGWIDGKASGFGKNLIMQKGWAGEWEESGFKDGYRHGWGVTCVTSDPKETIWYNGGFKDGDRHGYVIKSTGGLDSYTSVKNGVHHGYKTVKRDGVVQSREFFLRRTNA